MNVTVGAEWPTSGGGRRNYAVTLNEEDILNWRQYSQSVLWDKLNTKAEVLVVTYMYNEGELPKERYDARIAELTNA